MADNALQPIYGIIQYTHDITGSTLSMLEKKVNALDNPGIRKILDYMFPLGLSEYVIKYYKEKVAKPER